MWGAGSGCGVLCADVGCWEQMWDAGFRVQVWGAACRCGVLGADVGCCGSWVLETDKEDSGFFCHLLSPVLVTVSSLCHSPSFPFPAACHLIN
ncbi:hypothetical protein FKM82_029671 [Ascaphus truei]